MEKQGINAQGFKALLFTQFLGALNDNLFKTLISILIVYGAAVESQRTIYLSLAGALLVLPFIFFSPYAGYLADRFRKSDIIRYTKIFEVLIMSVSCFFLIQQNITALFLLLFLMGLQSCFFSPAKYGILPEILSAESLSRGNGFIQFWTFLAILSGTALSGLLVSSEGDKLWIAGVCLCVIAIIGAISARFVTRTEVTATKVDFIWNPFVDVARTLAEIRKNKNIFLALLAIAYFWFVGALVQLNILMYGSEMLGIGEREVAFLLTFLAVGIGLGSIAAGRTSAGKIELGLVPIGSFGLSLTAIVLGFSYQSYWLSMFVTFFLGFSGGMYIVPLSAFIQQHSPAASRGRYLATSNFLSFSGMLFASLGLIFLKNILSLNPAQVFLVLGILSIIVGIYIVRVLPEMLVRCINWILTHTFYRVTVKGLENLPEQGGALIVSNHVSFIDALIIQASVPRSIRFVMFRPIYDISVIRPVAQLMKAVPISGKDGREGVEKSLAQARELVKSGEIVGIFAEGGITRNGKIKPFKPGLESIMVDLREPIIPARLDGLWGSIFSFQGGRALWKLPKQIPYPIRVSFGRSLPASSLAVEVQEAVEKI